MDGPARWISCAVAGRSETLCGFELASVYCFLWSSQAAAVSRGHQEWMGGVQCPTGAPLAGPTRHGSVLLYAFPAVQCPALPWFSQRAQVLHYAATANIHFLPAFMFRLVCQKLGLSRSAPHTRALCSGPVVSFPLLPIRG